MESVLIIARLIAILIGADLEMDSACWYEPAGQEHEAVCEITHGKWFITIELHR